MPGEPVGREHRLPKQIAVALMVTDPALAVSFEIVIGLVLCDHVRFDNDLML